MTTVATRTRQISDLERFDIIVTRGSRAVSTTKNGILGPWKSENATKGTQTVAQFKRKFETCYPGYSCKVIDAKGQEAHGKTLLGTIRGSYES